VPIFSSTYDVLALAVVKKFGQPVIKFNSVSRVKKFPLDTIRHGLVA